MPEEVLHKHLRDKLHIKSLSETGEFEGYASTYSIDLDNERIGGPDAFKRTLQHTNGVVPILFGHSTNEPAGWNLEAVADEKGLKVRGKLTLETEIGKKAYYHIKGALEAGAKGAGLSIGFRVLKSHFETLKEDDAASGLKKGAEIRVFDEISLMEYSVCVFQANLASFVTAVKAKFDHDQKKEVAEGLEIGMSAPENVAEATGDPANKGTEVVEQTKAMTSSDASSSPSDFNANLRAAQRQRESRKQRSDIDNALYQTLSAIHGGDMDVPAKKAAVANCYDQHAKAMTSWHHDTYFPSDSSDSKSFDAGMLRKEDAELVVGKNEGGQLDLTKSSVLDPHVFATAVLEGIAKADAADDAELKDSPFKGGKIAKRLMKSFARVHKAHQEHGEVMKDMFGSDPGDDGVASTATEMGAMSEDVDDATQKQSDAEAEAAKGGDLNPETVAEPVTEEVSELEKSDKETVELTEAKEETAGPDTQQQEADSDPGDHSRITDLLAQTKSRLELLNVRN